jgi:hypothetical protein
LTGLLEIGRSFARKSTVESPEITMITDTAQMRALAVWYRERAEATDNPTIWESRLHTAENLEEMAQRADRRPLIVSPDQPDHRQLSPIAAADGASA